MVTVADCERVQTDWFRLQATQADGETWTDGPLQWVAHGGSQYLMFPTALPGPSLRRGVERARASGRSSVGVWLNLDVDPEPLAQNGFDQGWSPWWMTAPLPLAGPPDPRVELQTDTDDYGGEHAAYAEQLALTRGAPPRAWYAAAYQPGEPRRFAGRAWSFLDGDLAGVFDMAVWEAFRRRGFGTGLLRAVCTAAHRAGAEQAVLNATAMGERLYATCGFTQIGAGITWWRRLEE